MPAADNQKLEPVSGSAQLGENQNGDSMSLNNKSVNPELKNGASTVEDLNSNNNGVNASNNHTANRDINKLNEKLNNAGRNIEDEVEPTAPEDEVTFISDDPTPDVEVRIPSEKDPVNGVS